VRNVPRLCELYLGIYLTTEEKARKILSQGREMRRYCTRHRNVVEIWTAILQVGLPYYKLECHITNWTAILQVGLPYYKLDCHITSWTAILQVGVGVTNGMTCQKRHDTTRHDTPTFCRSCFAF